MNKKLYFILIVSCLGWLNSNSQQLIFKEYTSRQGLPDINIKQIVQDSLSRLWLLGKEGLFVFDGSEYHKLQANNIDSICSNNGEIYAYIDDNISKINLDDYSLDSVTSINKLISNKSDGLYQIENNSLVIKAKSDIPFPFKISSDNGLEEGNILCYLIDKNNNIWISIENAGLFMLPANYIQLFNWKNEKITKVQHYKDVRYHIITNKNVYVFDISNQSNFRLGLFPENTTAIEYQPNGYIWYGVKNKGLYFYLSDLNINYSFKRDIKSSYISDIQHYKNQVWISTLDKGLYLFNINNNRVQHLINDTANSIHQIEIIDKKLYGATEKGILELNLENFSFKYSFENQALHTIQKVKDNFYAIGKNSIIDIKNNKLVDSKGGKQWNNTIRIKDNTLSYILNDNEYKFTPQYLWGISFLENPVFEYFDEHFTHYYSATKEGLVMINKSYVHTNKIPLNVEQIIINGKPQEYAPDINLPFGNYTIEFVFNSPVYNQNISYQYSFKGLNEDSLQSTNQNRLRYSNLQEGKYQFSLQTINTDNPNISSKNLSINITISIPFWKRRAFIPTIIISLLGLFSLFYIRRTFLLKRRNIKLNQLVHERTHELYKKNQQLEQFSYVLSHDLKNPVANITGLTELIPENDENQEVLEKLHQSSELLEEKLKGILGLMKEYQENRKKVELIDIQEVYYDVCESIYIMIKESGIQITTDFIAPTLSYQKAVLHSIFYNMITNAIKYSSNDRIPKLHIKSKKQGSYIIISFEDNGLGIDLKKDEQRLFSMFERVHQQAEGSGVGLAMIKQIIELNGGKLEVESRLNQGTKFTVYLNKM